jgi:vacuolar-type H+-ATPase subunit E/Vma4
MEELQSTEILDREILEDARKKAFRILKASEETIHAQNAEWEKKTAENIDDLGKKYNEQKEFEAEKVMARLPIDKLRAKVEKIENLLQCAVESWYNGLSRPQILELLTGELAKRLRLCEEFSTAAGKRAYFSGLDRKEAETVLKSVNGSCKIEEIPSASHYPSITLETGNVRVIASIQKIVDFLLQEKREELVEALVGRDFMEEA